MGDFDGDYGGRACCCSDGCDEFFCSPYTTALVLGNEHPDTTCETEGVGYPDTLRHVKVPIVADSDCELAYSDFNPEFEMCAGLPEGGIDSCQGDSGGPLVISTGSGYAQGGVVSWGIGCADPGYYGVYGKIYAEMEWITETIAEN